MLFFCLSCLKLESFFFFFRLFFLSHIFPLFKLFQYLKMHKFIRILCCDVNFFVFVFFSLIFYFFFYFFRLIFNSGCIFNFKIFFSFFFRQTITVISLLGSGSVSTIFCLLPLCKPFFSFLVFNFLNFLKKHNSKETIDRILFVFLIKIFFS